MTSFERDPPASISRGVALAVFAVVQLTIGQQYHLIIERFTQLNVVLAAGRAELQRRRG
ncbi:predicted protein [Sclerotinia sclerotiorum 1980 UF-70]|uniref:Uncharacterized protein n=2 Tax=Sclerotinia sclerotiorum (strain ATCC 18683 / 1980 / Ss-1) TaxID=665079 RepID=A7EPB2_SCLS1|nr:predicted protein [Sclerotinia sclerotiorum 1980 UF-70]APA10366.1 hypothetical protein sscle_06g051360 [Sclerotinia sclerotiorum 1980 UF-70]EDO04678.1 predicted protein [Sclerotinia sclerotiorum 1980 UF-70]